MSGCTCGGRTDGTGSSRWPGDLRTWLFPCDADCASALRVHPEQWPRPKRRTSPPVTACLTATIRPTRSGGTPICRANPLNDRARSATVENLTWMNGSHEQAEVVIFSGHRPSALRDRPRETDMPLPVAANGVPPPTALNRFPTGTGEHHDKTVAFGFDKRRAACPSHSRKGLARFPRRVHRSSRPESRGPSASGRERCEHMTGSDLSGPPGDGGCVSLRSGRPLAVRSSELASTN